MADWNDLREHGAYAPSEILVAYSQIRPVHQELDNMVREGILRSSPEKEDVDRVLGLARFKIPGLEGAFSREVAEANSNAKLDTRREKFQPVDILLDKLRDAFTTKYQFTPTVGKNRNLAQVGDLHNIGGGGRGTPRAYGPGELIPRRSSPGTGVQVGIADTALLPNPWIEGAYQAAPYDRAGATPPPPVFTEGHAAFVTGLVLQQAPGCTVVARKVLDDDGQATSWSVAQELVNFARSGISVLNLSLGCLTDDNQPPLALATALDRIGPEVVVVAAAGNHNDPSRDGSVAVRPMWPAALEEVIAVGAVDANGTPCPWSPPPDTPWLDALAVGDRVVSTFLQGEVRLPKEESAEQPAQAPWTDLQIEIFPEPFLAEWSGTSFAAATVSGAIAARTVPGVYSARAAWDAIRRESKADPSSGASLITARPLLP